MDDGNLQRRHDANHVGFDNQMSGRRDGRGFNQATGQGRLLHLKILIGSAADRLGPLLKQPAVVGAVTNLLVVNDTLPVDSIQSLVKLATETPVFDSCRCPPSMRKRLI